MSYLESCVSNKKNSKTSLGNNELSKSLRPYTTIGLYKHGINDLICIQRIKEKCELAISVWQNHIPTLKKFLKVNQNSKLIKKTMRSRHGD